MSRRSFILLSAITFLLLGCGLSSIATTEGARRLVAEGVDRKDAIILTGSQPRTLDPATTLGGPDGPLGHIFSGLVTLDTSLQVQPDLAAGWEVSDRWAALHLLSPRKRAFSRRPSRHRRRYYLLLGARHGPGHRLRDGPDLSGRYRRRGREDGRPGGADQRPARHRRSYARSAPRRARRPFPGQTRLSRHLCRR